MFRRGGGVPNLRGYADARGLRWADDSRVAPFQCVFGSEPGAIHNTMRGTFPGGAYGVIAQRLVDAQFSDGGGGGFDPTTGASTGGASVTKVRERHTFAALHVPETKATLVTMQAYAGQAGFDAHGGMAKPLPDDGDWRLGLHARADRAVFDAVWRGTAGAHVRAAYPWGPDGRRGRRAPGGKLDVRAGIVSVWAPGFLEDPDELDALVTTTQEVAREISAACTPALRPARFDDPLPAPAGWTERGRAHGSLAQSLEKAKLKRVRRGTVTVDVADAGAFEHERFAGMRDFAHGYAEARGLAVEDGRSFDVAFPLPFGGWTQFACRGRLSDGAPYRVAVAALDEWFFLPQTAAGAAVAVAPAAPGTPDRLPGVVPDRPWFAGVTNGLAYVAEYVTGMNIDHGLLDTMAGALRWWTGRS